MYYLYKELPEAVRAKFRNAAYYNGIYLAQRSEEQLSGQVSVELEDVAIIDVDEGDTKEEVEADNAIVITIDPGTPLDDPKAEARRLARIEERRAERKAQRIEERRTARYEARKAARMILAEDKIVDLRSDSPS